MIPPSIVIAGYATGILLAIFLIVSARRGFSGTPASLRLLFAASAAFFGLLAVASALQAWNVPARSGSEFLYKGFVALFALAALGAWRRATLLGRLNPSLASLSGSLAGLPGTSVKTGIDENKIRLGISIKGQGESAAQDTPRVRSVQVMRSAVVMFDPKGELNAQSVAVLQQKIEKACARGPLQVVLDFTNVTAVDSRAAQSLVECADRLRDSQFSIVAPPGSAVEQALKQLGVDQSIPIEATPPISQQLLDAIHRAESQAAARSSTPTRDANTWKGF
jgi:anti-anti-sigma factor